MMTLPGTMCQETIRSSNGGEVLPWIPDGPYSLYTHGRRLLYESHSLQGQHRYSGDFPRGIGHQGKTTPQNGAARAVTGCCGFPCAGAPDPDRCPSAPASHIFSRSSPLWDNLCPSLGKKIARVPPLGGISCGDGFLWFPLLRGARL